MKKININILTIVSVALLTGISFTSCQKSIDVGNTSAVKVANQWWCRLLDTHGTELVGYSPFTTYNTSENKDSMWVDDNQNIYGFKVKVKFNSDQTFETAKSMNEYYDPEHPTNFPLSVVITDGKVMTNAGKSKTGVVVDSIYMKVIFSDDPGTTYILEGKAKTGWDKDDY
jgi:hypothetical protein